jgi:hypothetical protein
MKIPALVSTCAVLCALPATASMRYAETFDTPASITSWMVAGDPQNETTKLWLDGGGNPGGALEFGGFNTTPGIGKGYVVFRTQSGVDFTGLTTLSFDARLTQPSVATNVQMQIGIPGVAAAWHSLTNTGLSSDWRTWTFDVSNATPGTGTFRIDFLVAAGALEGSGAKVAIDNIAVVPEPSTYAILLGGLVLVIAFWRRRGRA